MTHQKFVAPANDPTPDASHIAKHRQCLSCLKAFASQWAGERICVTCRRSSTWQSGIARRNAFGG
jgi:hypothetical protein